MAKKRARRKQEPGVVRQILILPFQLVGLLLEMLPKAIILLFTFFINLIKKLTQQPSTKNQPANRKSDSLDIRPISSARANVRTHDPGKRVIDHLYFDLTYTEFEIEIARLFQHLGHGDVRRVGGANDRGVDITCTSPEGRRVVIQCKHYAFTHPVGSKDIQNFVGMTTRFHRAHQGIFVTTSSFTKEAITIGRGTGIQLIDGTELGRLYEPLYRFQTAPKPVPMPRSRSVEFGHTKAILASLSIVVIAALCLVGSHSIGDSSRDTSVHPTPNILTAVARVSITSTAIPATQAASQFPSPTNLAGVMPTPATTYATAIDKKFHFGDGVEPRMAANLYEDYSSPVVPVSTLAARTPLLIIGESLRDPSGQEWWPVLNPSTGDKGYLPASVLAARNDGATSLQVSAALRTTPASDDRADFGILLSRPNPRSSPFP